MHSSTTNISGGNIGYEGGSIVHVGGTLNLFGSGFTRTNIIARQFNVFVPQLPLTTVTGTQSTLTGTLLDGTPLNLELFLANGQTFNDRGGASQANPVLPNASENGIFTFTDVPSGAWFDPPIVDKFYYSMTDGKLFTGILDFPTGFASAFAVRVNSTIIGTFTPGQSVTFADFGFGVGVSSFTIENINPGVDAENPAGFPLQLGFNAPFASFTMQAGGSTAAPEPGTVGLVLLGGICAAMAGRKTARRGG